MISFFDACSAAFSFYQNQMHITGLAEAKEAEDCYIFGGGKKNTINIGGVIIRIDKQDGALSVLSFPSRDNALLIRSAKNLSIPDEFVREAESV